MRFAVTIAVVLASVAGRARADHNVAEAEEPTDDQVVVVNAAAKVGDIGQIARLHRVLDARHLLVKLPEQLEATLDGRNALIADLDSIKDAYAMSDYATALKIIDSDETRILDQAVSSDPIPSLAELSQWRGIIAAALNQEDEAVRGFRAAHRFNPAWSIDKKLASPRVRSMVKKSRREPDETGVLRVEADSDDATMSIDGGEARSTHGKVELTVGVHLVVVSADKRKSYAELVDISEGELFKFAIALDKESNLDRAARLVDESTAAPPGKARLKRARALSRLTGVKRMLFVEGSNDDHVTVRLYDVQLKKVSKPLDLDGAASSSMIARKVAAALDPENLIDADTVIVATDVRPEPMHWYQHWYVWAGAAAILGGGFASFEYMTREPTSVRGF